MRGHIIRKTLVILIIIAPILSYSGCKKQAKCGCDGDVLFSLTKVGASVYFDAEGNSISFQRIDNPYDTYKFCNPVEMFPKLSGYKSGDILEVWGNVYWDCSYLYQSSTVSSSYSYSYKIYEVQVSDVSVDPYGKK